MHMDSTLWNNNNEETSASHTVLVGAANSDSDYQPTSAHESDGDHEGPEQSKVECTDKKRKQHGAHGEDPCSTGGGKGRPRKIPKIGEAADVSCPPPTQAPTEQFIPCENTPKIDELRKEVFRARNLSGIRVWLRQKGLEWNYDAAREVCEWDIRFRDLSDVSVMRLAVALSSGASEFAHLLTLCVMVGQPCYFHQLSLYLTDNDLPIAKGQVATVARTLCLPHNAEAEAKTFERAFCAFQGMFLDGVPKFHAALEILDSEKHVNFPRESSKLVLLRVPQPAMERFGCQTDDLPRGYWAIPAQSVGSIYFMAHLMLSTYTANHSCFDLTAY